MADTRPADDPTTALADLQKQFDDLKSTLLARTARLPTGTMLGTLLSAPPANTVFLQGQTLQKTAFPVLWQWASDNSPGGFTVSASTLVVPDLRDRVLIGAGAAALGTVVGANTITLSNAQMPSHTHGFVSGHGVSTTYGHDHGGTGGGGSHNHGISATRVESDASHNHTGPGDQLAQAPNTAATGYGGGGLVGTDGVGGHYHGMNTDSHNHGVTLDALSLGSAGSGSTVDVRQSSFAVNVLIWT